MKINKLINGRILLYCSFHKDTIPNEDEVNNENTEVSNLN